MDHGILKNQLQGSNLGLKGNTPPLRDGALPTSQLHAQELNPTIMKADHSIHDYDGKRPDHAYKHPETGATFNG